MSIGILAGLFLAYIICAVDSESKKDEGNEIFIKSIIRKAEKNLTPWEVKDVKRLIASVKYKKHYAAVTEEEIENL